MYKYIYILLYILLHMVLSKILLPTYARMVDDEIHLLEIGVT